MNIVFLDIDGVLNYNKAFWKEENRQDVPHVIDSKCLDQLERIVNETGAKIVLSSTWRLNDISRGVVAGKLLERGMKIWSMTPDLETTDRWREILDWIHTNKADYSKYAVLDDDEDANLYDGSFFKTNFNKGLTKEIADDVIEYFNT